MKRFFDLNQKQFNADYEPMKARDYASFESFLTGTNNKAKPINKQNSKSNRPESKYVVQN